MGTQQMILYAVATLIVAFVFLIQFGIQRRSSEAAIDAMTYRAAKQDMMNLVEAIDQDFKNIGSYLYNTDMGFVGDTLNITEVIRPGWYDSTAVAGGNRYWFQFKAQTDSFRTYSDIDLLDPVDLVRYEWEPIDGETVTLDDGTTRQLYEVRRLIDDGSGFTLDGSSNTITEMKLDLLPDTTSGMTTLVNLYDTRVIRVSLTGASRLGKGQTIEETHFDAVYRPVAMTIKDNAN